MCKYEIPKRLGYPKTVFYDDAIILSYKNGIDVKINPNDIDRIEYVKPSVLSYLSALVWFGGTFPGRMEVYMKSNTLLNPSITKKMYLIKISYNDILKLPNIYKEKMGWQV